jgi:cell division protein FtsI/penicillin-binding protein 2
MHCWTYLGHGLLNLPQALGISCNLFFARLGLALGKEKLLAQLDPYPFSEKNSLNKDKLRGAALANFAIGNSPDFQVTPQEMAKFWNQYLDKISTPAFAPIQQGLVRSAQSGTASRAGASGIQILGKTGTGASMKKSYKTNAWFLGAYPTENPRYALVVFLQEAYGFREAAELAGKIFSLAQENGVLQK